MADYLKKIQEQKEELSYRLNRIRVANNISMESIERIFPLEWAEAIENGGFITDRGVIIGIDKILAYCDLIGAAIGPFNNSEEK